MVNNLRYLSLCVMFIITGLYGVAQYPAISTHPDTAQYPYWIQMMQDPDAKFEATRSAFNQYWQNRPLQKGDGWKVFKRWEYINESRVQPDGKLPAPDDVMREFENYSRNHQPLSATGSWTQTGPILLPANATGQPNGLGRINGIGFHPTDANTIYIGSPSGGLWRTTDGGLSWTTLTEALPTLGVSSIVVLPSAPNTIFIGTGDRDAGDAPGMGVYKSINGGSTWAASNSGMGNLTVGMLLLHPGNSDIMLASTSGGIYKSINGGANWTRKSGNTNNYKDIKFNPGDPTIVYASEGGKFYRSTDTGDTWVQITLGVTGTRLVIGVSPNNPSYVYLAQTNGVFAGILRSNNSGQSFATQCTTPNIMDYSCDGSGTSTQAWYDLCITVDPNNAEIIWVGGVNIWKSVNGGVTMAINSHWVGSCSVPAVHADIHTLEWSPLSGKLYVGCDGGLYQTANGGTNWADISSGLAIAQVYKIGQSATNEPLCINGYQDNGTSTNVGSAFTTVIGGDGMECIIDYTDANYRYGSIYYGAIYRYAGSYYGQIAGNGYSGITEAGAWVTPFILHTTNPNTMFAGYKNVWRSTNVKAPSGIVFTAISTGETSNCSVLEQSPANADVLYVVRSGQLKRTNNANDPTPSWVSCTLPGGSTPTDLAAHPGDANILYATAGGKVYKSPDQGATWSNISGTLPSVTYNCIVYDKNSNEGLYVGARTGVYYKDASLTDWAPFGTGLPMVDVRELEIYYGADYSSSRLKAATYGRGLWKSDLIETGVLNPLSFAGAPVSTSEIDLTWTQNPTNNNVVLAFNTSPSFGTPVNGTSYSCGSAIPGGGTVIFAGGGNSFNHTALSINTNYYYKIWSYNGTTSYSLGSIANAATFCTLLASFPWLEGYENAGNLPLCWTQEFVSGTNNWTAVTQGYNGFPAAAHTSTYLVRCQVSGYSAPVTKLVSPPINLSGLANPVLRFWHTQYPWSSDQDELRVYYRTSFSGAWNLLATYTGSITSWTQENLLLPTPSSTYYIAFEAKAKYGYGVCIDDVTIMTNSLSWAGTGSWNDNARWVPPFVPAFFDDVTISVGTCTVNNDVSCKTVTVNTGAQLTVTTGKVLTANGNLIINP